MNRLEHRIRLHAPHIAALTALAILLAGAAEAWAIKWDKAPKSCPNYPRKQQRRYPIGKYFVTQAPFIHPGHEMGIFFGKAPKGAFAGFSTEPGGNVVEITFRPNIGRPNEGDPIPLPPIAVTAVSPTALYFDFPDPREVLGRIVVGPMTITIRTPNAVYPDLKTKVVVLPPANDVGVLLEDGADLEILAAPWHDRFWIPLQFNRFGEAEPMASCPGTITPKTAMTIGLTMTGKDGAAIPYATVASLRKARMFLGDFVLDGVNHYGFQLKGQSLEIPGPHRGRVGICAMNDAVDLVLAVGLSPNASRPKSRILPTLLDGSPYRIQLRDVSADPNPGGRAFKADSFGSKCALP